MKYDANVVAARLRLPNGPGVEDDAFTLLQAARVNNIRSVKTIIEDDKEVLNVQHPVKSYNILHMAVMHYSEMVEQGFMNSPLGRQQKQYITYLLEKGVDPNHPSTEGNTPIEFFNREMNNIDSIKDFLSNYFNSSLAIQTPYFLNIRMLLSLYALGGFDEEDSMSDDKRDQYFNYALELRHTKAIQKFLTDDDEKYRTILLDYQDIVPLFATAAALGQLELVKTLVKAGVDPNALSRSYLKKFRGSAPAIVWAMLYGCYECAEYLAGVTDPNTLIEVLSENNITNSYSLFIYLCKTSRGHELNIIKKMVTGFNHRTRNMFTETSYGEPIDVYHTSLSQAMEAKNYKIVQLILETINDDKVDTSFKPIVDKSYIKSVAVESTSSSDTSYKYIEAPMLLKALENGSIIEVQLLISYSNPLIEVDGEKMYRKYALVQPDSERYKIVKLIEQRIKILGPGQVQVKLLREKGVASFPVVSLIEKMLNG